MTTEAITPLRQRMIEDMSSRKLCVHTQRSHIYSCKRFAALGPDFHRLDRTSFVLAHLLDHLVGAVEQRWRHLQRAPKWRQALANTRTQRWRSFLR